MSYVYYQENGGDEDWKAIQTKHLGSLSVKPTFVTVLSVDSLLPEKPTKEQLEGLKYEGPMYFDLDSSSIEESITDAKALWVLLKGLGLTANDVSVYLSGKKGFHFLIPQAVFMEKPGAVRKLPLIYKEMAMDLVVPSLDFKVYSARRGRMLRTCHNSREVGNNPAWKVQIPATELDNLTPESYRSWCSEPRAEFPINPEFRYKLGLIYDAAYTKVPKTTKKVAPTAPHIVKSHWSEVSNIFSGQAYYSAGFNSIAIQMALYAREADWNEETFISKAAGFIENYSNSDGRYANTSVRERELRKMFQYVDDNPSYTYSLSGVTGVAKGKRPEPVQDGGEYIDCGDIPEDYESGEAVPEELGKDFTDQLTGGLQTRGVAMTSTTSDGSERTIANWNIHSTLPLHDPETGDLISIRVYYWKASDFATASAGRAGELPKKFFDILPSQFTGNTSLQNAIAPYGLVFTGSDMNSRGLLHTVTSLDHQIKNGSEAVESFMVGTEGITLIKLPHSKEAELRDAAFLVWADANGINMPAQFEHIKTRLEYVGWPNPHGTIRSDLSQAADIAEYLRENGTEKFIKMWVDLLSCQTPASVGKLVGWMAAAPFKPLFQACYSKFPLMHVYGPAGSGKTEMTMSMLKMFYKDEDPKTATPASTAFAISSLVSSTASIPVVLDEYKPHKMNREVLERFRGMFRDLYNAASVTRGGGSRASEKAVALNETKLQAPVAFIAEAIESETAILERSVVVNIRPQPPLAAAQGLVRFMSFKEKSQELLPMFGLFMSRWVISKWDLSKLRTEFDALHAAAMRQYMLNEDDVNAYRDGELTKEEFEAKSRVKPRPIYNATVALFGLRQAARVIAALVGREQFDEHLKTLFQQISEVIYDGLGAVTDASIPEYIKALRTIAEMIVAPATGANLVNEGVEYNLVSHEGKELLVLLPSVIYSRYRTYVRSMGAEPLFDNETAFTVALQDCPQFVMSGSGTAKLRVRSIVLDYESLVAAGVTAITTAKIVTLPAHRFG